MAAEGGVFAVGCRVPGGGDVVQEPEGLRPDLAGSIWPRLFGWRSFDVESIDISRIDEGSAAGWICRGKDSHGLAVGCISFWFADPPGPHPSTRHYVQEHLRRLADPALVDHPRPECVLRRPDSVEGKTRG